MELNTTLIHNVICIYGYVIFFGSITAAVLISFKYRGRNEP